METNKNEICGTDKTNSKCKRIKKEKHYKIIDTEKLRGQEAVWR